MQLTAEQIKMALECCGNEKMACCNKKCKINSLQNALRLVNEYEATIEDLTKQVELLTQTITELRAELDARN